MNTSRARRRGSLAQPLVACAIAALLIDLGTVHSFQSSDSVVPVLSSLYHWTPFYWAADRFGQPVPLLTIPFTNPLANLLIQTWINLFVGLAVIPLLARWAVNDSDAMTAGGIAAILYLALMPAKSQFAMSANPYPLSMALVAGGLILIAGNRPGAKRWLAAMALITLAHWVNVSSFVYFAPFLLLRALIAEPPSRWRRSAAQLAVLLTGASAGLLFKHLADAPTTPLDLLPTSEWPAAWATLSGNVWQTFHALGLAAVFTAALGVGACGRDGPLRRRGLPWREPTALCIAAVAIVLFVGTMGWVRFNAYSSRYAYPAVMFALVGLSALAAAPLRALFPQWERGLGTALAASLPLLALVTFGLPSPQAMRRAVEGDRDQTEAILASGATHMAGNYWKVWIAVYRANLALHERGERRIIWGLSNRSRATEALWSKVPRATTRIVALQGDADVDRWLELYGYADLHRIAENQTLIVYGSAD